MMEKQEEKKWNNRLEVKCELKTHLQHMMTNTKH